MENIYTTSEESTSVSSPSLNAYTTFNPLTIDHNTLHTLNNPIIDSLIPAHNPMSPSFPPTPPTPQEQAPIQETEYLQRLIKNILPPKLSPYDPYYANQEKRREDAIEF